LQLAGALCGLLAYFVLGHYLDRRGGFGATPLGMLLVGLVPVVYLVAPSQWFLAIAYILLTVGNSVIDLSWQHVLVSRVSDEHRLRYQAAHTSITGLRGAAAPFAGSLLLGMGVAVGPVLLISGALGVVGAGLMARALGISLRSRRPERGSVRPVVRDTGRPGRDVAVSHGVVGQGASIDVAPALDVKEVLLPRQQGPATDALARRRSAQGMLESPHQLLHDPAWQALTIARVDEAEQDQVTEQHAPVGAKSAE
jgi:MFS family permease